jgi:enamine deaminase RidA (YjgF/YER057c/UK114 family)
MTDKIEAKLAEMDLTLPTAPEVIGYYVPAIKTGNLVITSGQLPIGGKEVLFTGKVGGGGTLGETEASDAARICALNALAQIKALIGSLEKIKRIVRVEGYVNSSPGFTAQALVVNGASHLFVQLFGDAGKHTRVSVGVAELPLNAAVELAVWAEVEE